MLFCEALKILGVDKSATSKEIKDAYRKLAKLNHPDVVPHSLRPAAEAKFKEIARAYTILASNAGRPIRYSSDVNYDANTAQQYRSWRSKGGIRYAGLVGLPFFCLISGIVGLGITNMTRAYRKVTNEYSSSSNPFLP